MVSERAVQVLCWLELVGRRQGSQKEDKQK